jgi:hypothetical protein
VCEAQKQSNFAKKSEKRSSLDQFELPVKNIFKASALSDIIERNKVPDKKVINIYKVILN